MSRNPGRLLLVLSCICLASCYGMRPSSGGGQTEAVPQKSVNAADIAVSPGYRIEPVAAGLTFPTGVDFDDSGNVYVTEAGYSYGEVWTVPRLVRVEAGGKITPVASGAKNGPWTGLTFYKGAFYIAEGGELEGGSILRVTPDGVITRLVEGLPSRGDHHTNGPVAGPDGFLYFGIGTYTNSGVVGEDNAKFGWMKRYPNLHDVPCQDVTLSGENFSCPDPLKPGGGMVITGAFSPFGTATQKGQVIQGRVPCSGAVLRISPQGGPPELVAWGFRNPFGLAFSPGGELYITDNQYDERGSRPVFGSGDLLWAVKKGTWYGWPDYHGAHPLNHGDRYKPPGKEIPRLLLAKHPNQPPEPAAVLGVHASGNGFDFSRSPKFGHVGEAFIAEFGDQAPETGKVLGPVGFKVVRVDPRTGIINDFAVNRGNTNGPASLLQSGGLERPIAARFSPDGSALYVLDFGIMTLSKAGPAPRKNTGVLWRITRTQ